MKQFYESVEKAIKSYQTADHLVHTTYLVVKDPKLMLLAAKHLRDFFDNGMSALIYYDYYYKRIPHLPKDFKDKIDLFRRFICDKYNMPRSIIQLILDLNNIYSEHKSSEIEFRRKNNFVIATKNYKLRTLNSEKLKNFLVLSKPLLIKITEVKKINDRRII
ncbi:hypothetical protein HN992_03480 [Candidatus Woesearchaeota archaeon]|nr:hypothetical protein [Candidatus Woesearchaeota archaeon]